MAVEKKQRSNMATARFGSGKGNTLRIEFNEVEEFPWSVTREGEDITFKLGEGTAEKEKAFKTTDIREFLISNYNWNGIVNMMHLLQEKSDRLETYTRPTTLKGIPTDDDILIIPDEATEAIIYEQAKYAIETKYVENTDQKIEDIIGDGGSKNGYVDGMPKTSFPVDVLSTTRDDLLKEVDNTSMEYEGESFVVPDFKTVNESDLYDFLKKLVLSRNGLWIDEGNRINFMSIRRILDTSSSKYNDTSFLVWKEGTTKKALQYISSTEPGDLGKGQLLPQTTTMILGIHDTSNATPSGRTRNAYRKGNGNTNHYFQEGDTTMNIHYANHGIYKNGFPKNKSEYGLKSNSDGSYYEGDELDAYLTCISVLRILSRWGTGKSSSSKTSYENLENHTKDYTMTDVIGNTDVDKKIDIKIGEGIVKSIMLSTYRTYIQANYSSAKTKALQLLMYHNKEVGNGILKSSYDNTTIIDIVSELKKEEVFKNIVKLQFNEELNTDKIDGKPGGGTIKKAERTDDQKSDDAKEYNDLIAKAESDWNSITEDLATWDTNTILKKELRTKFKNEFRINKVDYKEADIKDVDDSGGIGINKGVGGWSEGCQVILGGQHFYEFMYLLTKFIKESKQKRWYYTLVDIDTIDGVTKGEPSE